MRQLSRQRSGVLPAGVSPALNIAMPALALLALLITATTASGATAVTPQRLELFDATIARRIPLALYPPATGSCSGHCPVAIFGTGYQMTASDYTFIGETLSAAGYLTLVIQYDLQEDAPMPYTGNIRSDRNPYWQRGANSLQFALSQLPASFSDYAWAAPIIMGHSQGGDIAALFAAAHPDQISALVTLDNRRVPLPRNASYPLLSLRSADQPADPGVLPAEPDAACILKLPEISHNDMADSGPAAAKALITSTILRFIKRHDCRL